jgi:sugar transferase (PEP-CTERM/EpsH1 system associated)
VSEQPLLIAHVVHSLGVGGLENGVVNLVNAPAAGVRHVIVCMTRDGTLRCRLDPAISVFSLNKHPGHDLPTFFRLVRLLRQLNPGLVHSRNWATFDAIVAARLARVPVVVHGEHGRDITDPHGLHRHRNQLRRWLSPLVDCFVTVSDDLGRWLVTEVRIPPRKVRTIPNGVDATRFAPCQRTSARTALGLVDTGPVVGTVGRLDPVKDHQGLVRAFATVRRDHPDAVLVIAGDGPCREELCALIGKLGLQPHVRLLGERDDIPTVLGAMDVFVLPSIAEGMSNTIIEAMACGLPVVATRVGGNCELVEDGVTGKLIPPQDVATLATAINRYLSSAERRAADGQSARQRVLDGFSLERMRAAYADLYASLRPRAA